MRREARMSISTEGLEASGKSRFALEATPRPVTYLDFDFGAEGIGSEAMYAGVTRYAFDLSGLIGMSDDEARKRAMPVMQEFLARFREAVGKPGTIVVDTFTAAWAGQRVARNDERYVLYEQEFRSLVKSVMLTDCTSLVLTHHMKPDWKRDAAGKSYKGSTHSRDGMDGVLDLVQLALRQRYVPPVPAKMVAGRVVEDGQPGRFEMDVLKCRDQVGLTGATMPAMDFRTLCSVVCPGVDWWAV